MNVLEDKYKLKDSVIVRVDITDSCFIDLGFKEEENNNLNGQVYGVVKDEYNQAISNALVQIMSDEYVPVMYTLTDNDGNYLIVDVPVNTNYRMYVSSPYKELENGLVFSLNELERYETNFILKDEINQTFSALGGNVIDKISKLPISDAVVYIYYLDSNGNMILKSIENTDKKGNFIFWQLPIGNYLVQINAMGYTIKNTYESITSDNQEVDIMIQLDKNNQSINGTIYGTIKDSNGNPISEVDVILYQVNSNNLLVPIKFIKSDNDGVYLFANIPDGIYKVKAGKFIEKDI